MNIAQRLVLTAGLVVIASLFYAPYSVEKYYYDTSGGFADKPLKYDNIEDIHRWVEFYLVFTPPVNMTFEGQRRKPNGYLGNVATERKRDWVLHGSIIAGEILALALLFFVFKTKRLKN